MRTSRVDPPDVDAAVVVSVWSSGQILESSHPPRPGIRQAEVLGELSWRHRVV